MSQAEGAHALIKQEIKVFIKDFYTIVEQLLNILLQHKAQY